MRLFSEEWEEESQTVALVGGLGLGAFHCIPLPIDYFFDAVRPVSRPANIPALAKIWDGRRLASTLNSVEKGLDYKKLKTCEVLNKLTQQPPEIGEAECTVSGGV